MVKKFNIPCVFGGEKRPVAVYIGAPEPGHHPLHFQSDWLSKERGGTIPKEIMEILEKLKNIADTNGVPFEELCKHAFEAAAGVDNISSEGNFNNNK